MPLCLIPISKCKLPFVRSFAVFTTRGLPLRPFVTFTESICFFHDAFVVGHGKREIVWGELQHHDVLRVLHQPAYAGAYVFGRTRTTKSADGKVHIAEVPRAQWDTLVKNAHIGYITWEDYERNETQLAMNSQAYVPERFSPPREGPALEASASHLWKVWRTHDCALSPTSRSAHRA